MTDPELIEAVRLLAQRVGELRGEVQRTLNMVGHLHAYTLGFATLALEDQLPQIITALEQQKKAVDSPELEEALSHILRVLPKSTDLKAIVEMQAVKVH